MARSKPVSPFPSVDSVARSADVAPLIETYGRGAVIEAIRTVVGLHRSGGTGLSRPALTFDQIVVDAAQRLADRQTPSLRRVFNMTGTVLHTNLGRAQLPEAAIEHAAMAMREACSVEFDLESGRRGERDTLVEGLLTELTGAEAATVVNNNAAAVLLALAALASPGQVVLSRGELIEIGGHFRIPDVMRSADVRLVEVGTTNRTHRTDYENAIGPDTAALMKVHTSNYRIVGFTAEVGTRDLSEIARARGLPFIVDLGAGSLIDLSALGLPKEPVVREVLSQGADVVTFSGDKLLGGPQAGLVVGRKDLIERIRRHPLKRALRLSKLTLAALEGTLLAYRTPDRLVRDLPTLRLLTRPVGELQAMAARLVPQLAAALGGAWRVESADVASQIGSGALPDEMIPSVALAISPAARNAGSAVEALARCLLRRPIPIVGRIADQQLILDLRCLEDEPAFVAQFSGLQAGPESNLRDLG